MTPRTGPEGLRRLCRAADGTLHDLHHHRPVSLDELCEDLRRGRPFRAYRQHTGTDCTNEVLVEVLLRALPHGGWKPAAIDLTGPVERLLHALTGGTRGEA
ncbi:hypothetical protein ACQP1W_23965 [Spirillospora sp. CA-255316]